MNEVPLHSTSGFVDFQGDINFRICDSYIHLLDGQVRRRDAGGPPQLM